MPRWDTVWYATLALGLAVALMLACRVRGL